MTKHSGPFCGGRLKQREGTCTQPAGWGTDHAGHGRCKLHGGSTPSHRAAAVEHAARAELARLNLPPVDDPLSALAQVTAEVVAWKDMMAAKVNELTSLRYEGEGSGEQLRSEVALWERALDRCERFLTAMARLKIDDRLAAISDARATAVVSVILIALDAARVTDDQRHAAIAAADAEFARQAGITLG